MNVTVYTAENAPQAARLVDPFRNDDRCDTIVVVEATCWNDIVLGTREQYLKVITPDAPFANTHLHDLDWVEDSTTEKWFGYVCRDKEPFDAEVA